MKVREFYKKLDKATITQSIVFRTSTGARGTLIEHAGDFIRICYPDLEAPIYDYPIKSIHFTDCGIMLLLGPKRKR